MVILATQRSDRKQPIGVSRSVRKRHEPTLFFLALGHWRFWKRRCYHFVECSSARFREFQKALARSYTVVIRATSSTETSNAALVVLVLCQFLGDGLSRNMRDALPNAEFICFTGTPIEQNDANTRAVFGESVSSYEIQQVGWTTRRCRSTTKAASPS